ncbi:ABC transporter ATP-binding protein [Microlunatus panaciterrae]|uniref:Peptide/nickel transport system ATP-binding protein n=1 Tax=Microlunatus panaciterrae TaxID=400768 RepID=A0ABS2RIZ1_9ACTN|nr:ABC transporter ATP-binding protein [Microlunatus panaciterrae]MBM7798973.1 peptide/nickel transport system ATP-binding protein [Microlunatus panaciterrae]
MSQPEILLEIKDLKTHFFLHEGIVRAVDGVNLTVPAGKTICVVGESGCGKSIMARSILRLIERPGRIVGGELLWSGQSRGGGTVEQRNPDDQGAKRPGTVDLATLDASSEELRNIRGAQIAMVFQEPMASLSPMYTVGNQLTEAIRLHLPMSPREARQRGLQLLEHVGIPRASRIMESYPFQLSGGMCQRVMIAIALSCGPQLLIADEPTTALDVTTQARIIDLLRDLQDETGMAMMFITHDLGVVAEVADEVVVMYLGTVVEQGNVDDLFHDPQHPYTKALLRSIPKMGSGRREALATIRGQVPHPQNRPAGCPFHPRCDYAMPGLCDQVEPPLVKLGPRRVSRCVLHDRALMASHGVSATEQKEDA